MTTTFNSNREWFQLLAILLKGCAVSEVWSSGTEGMASGQLGQLRVVDQPDLVILAIFLPDFALLNEM